MLTLKLRELLMREVFRLNIRENYLLEIDTVDVMIAKEWRMLQWRIYTTCNL